MHKATATGSAWHLSIRHGEITFARLLRWMGGMVLLAMAAPEAKAANEPGSAETENSALALAPDDGSTGIVVSAPTPQSSADPMGKVNERSFTFVQSADRAVVAPLAMAYDHALPVPLREGIHNVLYNLREPVVITNYMLQHRIGKAGQSLARLAINSTLGIGGIFDIAKRKPFHLTHHVNGFANTLGFYGVKPGPYMYLPIVGSTTLRDLVGTVADRMFLSVVVGAPFTQQAYRVPVVVLGTLDDRVVNDARIRRLRSEPGSSYLATRDAYLASRQSDIANLHKKSKP